MSVMRTIIAPGLIGLMILIVGCSSLSVYHDIDTDADFTTYKTYDWKPASAVSSEEDGETKSQNSKLAPLIESTVDAQLIDKGLRRDTDNPDLLVRHLGGAANTIDVTGYGYSYGESYSGWQGDSIGLYPYKEGSLVLDLIDTKTGKLVWRGTAQGTVVSSTAKQDRKMVVNAIKKMFENYPPEK